MKQKAIELKINENFTFYSPEEQGFDFGADDEFVEEYNALVVKALDRLIAKEVKKSFKVSAEDYNQLIKENIEEIFSDAGDTYVFLSGNFVELILDHTDNRLVINLQSAVDGCIETIEKTEDDLLPLKLEIVEFWEQSAKRLREKYNDRNKRSSGG